MTTAELTALRDKVREMRLQMSEWIDRDVPQVVRSRLYATHAAFETAESELTLAAYHRGLAEPKGEDYDERQRRVDAGLANGGPVKIEAYGPYEHKRRRGVCDIPPPATGWQEAGDAAMEIRCEQCGELVKGLVKGMIHSCRVHMCADCGRVTSPGFYRCVECAERHADDESITGQLREPVRPPEHPVTVEEARAVFGELVKEGSVGPPRMDTYCRESNCVEQRAIGSEFCESHRHLGSPGDLATQIKNVAEEKCVRCNGEKVVRTNIGDNPWEPASVHTKPCPLCHPEQAMEASVASNNLTKKQRKAIQDIAMTWRTACRGR